MKCKHLQSINSNVTNDTMTFQVYNCELYGICTEINQNLFKKDGSPMPTCSTCISFEADSNEKALKMQDCNCKTSLINRMEKLKNT